MAGPHRSAVDHAPASRRVWRRLVLASVAGSCLLLGPGTRPAWGGAVLPERGGSPNADRIASLYTVVLVLAALVLLGVTAALGYALIRYRADRSPVAAQIRGNTRLEIAWTVAAALLIVFIAVFSLTRVDAIEHPDPVEASPAAVATGIGGALHIEVIGQQYVWEFRYPNGAYSFEELVAPVGVTVKLDIVALDVAHSWWLPKLGGKLDAIPGYVNHTWFRLEREGVYRGQCAELCGRNHADMIAQVRGVSPAAYASWVERQKRSIAAAKDALIRAPHRLTPGAP
jgi:cytochrome c oxidase subunit II